MFSSTFQCKSSLGYFVTPFLFCVVGDLFPTSHRGYRIGRSHQEANQTYQVWSSLDRFKLLCHGNLCSGMEKCPKGDFRFLPAACGMVKQSTPYRLRNQSLANFFGNEDTKTLFGVLNSRKRRCHLIGQSRLGLEKSRNVTFLVSVSSRSRKIILQNSRSRLGLEKRLFESSRLVSILGVFCFIFETFSPFNLSE